MSFWLFSVSWVGIPKASKNNHLEMLIGKNAVNISGKVQQHQKEASLWKIRKRDEYILFSTRVFLSVSLLSALCALALIMPIAQLPLTHSSHTSLHAQDTQADNHSLSHFLSTNLHCCLMRWRWTRRLVRNPVCETSFFFYVRYILNNFLLTRDPIRKCVSGNGVWHFSPAVEYKTLL